MGSRPEVHVVGLQDRTGELGVREGVLGGQAATGEHGRAANGGGEGVGGHPEGFRPGGGAQVPVVVADERVGDAVLGEVREGETALVAVPLLIDLRLITGKSPLHLAAAHIGAQRATARAVFTHGRHGHQVEGASPEAVPGIGQGTDRADLHGVAREVGVERGVLTDPDLLLGSPLQQVDEGIAGDLVGEPGAPRTGHAPLAVEQDLRAHVDRLGERALRPLEAALRPSGAHGLVLQRALPALVADRTVQRVVQKQELHHTLLCVVGDLGRALGADHHVVADRNGAGGLRLRLPLDLHQAHPTRGHGVQQRVVAEARDLDAELLGRADDQRAFLRGHRHPVDAERDVTLGHGHLVAAGFCDGHAFTSLKTVLAAGSKATLLGVVVPASNSSAKYFIADGKGVAAASPRAQKERPRICPHTLSSTTS